MAAPRPPAMDHRTRGSGQTAPRGSTQSTPKMDDLWRFSPRWELACSSVVRCRLPATLDGPENSDRDQKGASQRGCRFCFQPLSSKWFATPPSHVSQAWKQRMTANTPLEFAEANIIPDARNLASVYGGRTGPRHLPKACQQKKRSKHRSVSSGWNAEGGYWGFCSG